jgi:dihydromethanopterin reductase
VALQEAMKKDLARHETSFPNVGRKRASAKRRAHYTRSVWHACAFEIIKARRETLMQVTDVRAVIAIGLSGQFGLRGRLPWEGNRGREFVADVERFFELTRGHVLIMGHRTFTSVPDFAFQNRDIIEVHASDAPEEVLARFPGRVVFIGGGPPVYAAYAPFIRHWDISRLPYGGEADRWFDPALLVAGRRT